jgi:hypothetical protein
LTVLDKPGRSGGKNSVEFSFPDTPAAKIQSNFPSRTLRRQKFSRIFLPGRSGDKNSVEFSFPDIPAIKSIK